MSENFVDYVRICCRSGKGGAGSMHFLRNAKTDKGGPDGGDGGKGGSITLKGNSHLWTLLALRYRKHVLAGDGGNGTGGNCHGSDGDNVIIEVPLGTVAKDDETGEILFEITKHGETRVLLGGGRGGLGNNSFKSPTNQVPTYAQPGESAKEEWKILELKVLADVGLVGFPNAGKSTLLSVISAAKPKIGDYAFTTLTPNLGIVPYRDFRSFIVADIPGIIENAHEGKGLGHRFLRHIERNSVLLFMIACDSPDIKKEYKILLNELAMYNEEMLDKPRVLAITKCDMADKEMVKLLKPTLPRGIKTVFISAIAQQGLQELKDLLWATLNPEVVE